MHLVASRLSPGGLFSGILKHFCNTCHQECTFTLCAQKFIVLLWILSEQKSRKTDYCAKNVSRTDRLVFIAQSDKSSLLLSILRLKV